MQFDNLSFRDVRLNRPNPINWVGLIYIRILDPPRKMNLLGRPVGPPIFIFQVGSG